jgi:phage-related protein
MHPLPLFSVVFFLTDAGNEPVRDWLKTLTIEERKTIGEDIKLVQFRWPLGLPLVRKLEADLWEVRSRIAPGKSARVFFTVKGSLMVLVHGFIKKSQKTPQKELNLARNRKKQWLERGIAQ